jgi:TPR repeat protein
LAHRLSARWNFVMARLIRPLSQEAIGALRRAARAGEPSAAANLAAEYRILGRRRLAYRWWCRAVEHHGGGDEWLEIAYCLHHRIGVARDLVAAQRAYERARRAKHTTPYGHEEACYQLATLLLEVGQGSRRRLVTLLRRANRDDDYPQARALLAQVLTGDEPIDVCQCRRGLARSLGGSASCRVHRAK